MVPDEGIVTTDVDALIRVVQQKKEVSVPDVARELNVPEATIEAWATFLEEEGIISIKYKFTKPFLVFKEGKVKVIPKKPKVDKKLEKDIEEDIKERAREAKEKAEEEPKEEKPPEAPAKEEEKKEIKPSKVEEHAKELLKKTEESLGKGEIDKARQLYHKLRDEYDHLPDQKEER